MDSRGAEGMRADNESMEARLRKLAARVQVLHQQGKSSADLDFTKVSFMTEQTLYEACMVGGARRQQPRAADSYGPLTRCTLLAFSSATTVADVFIEFGVPRWRDQRAFAFRGHRQHLCERRQDRGFSIEKRAVALVACGWAKEDAVATAAQHLSDIGGRRRSCPSFALLTEQGAGEGRAL